MRYGHNTESRVATDSTVIIAIEHCELGCHVTEIATPKLNEQSKKTM